MVNILNRAPKALRSALLFLLAALFCALAIPEITLASEPDQKKPPASKTESAFSGPLRFYQNTISRADGDRCPMHPTCSRYSLDAFKQHDFFTAWMLTCDRLLRCGHDEIHLAPRVRIGRQIKASDPLAANTFWWSKP